MMNGEPKQIVKECANEGCKREFASYEYPWRDEVEYCSIECWAANEEEPNTGHEIPEVIMRQTYHF